MKKFLKNLFSKNTRLLKKYEKLAKQIEKEHLKIKDLSDEEIKQKYYEIKKSIENGDTTLQKNIINVYSMIKEASIRSLNMNPYTVQLIGGLVLNDGNIAEMKTGEGKTLVASFPAILNALVGNVHIVTVNDYLTKRDSEILKPLYNFFGLSVGLLNKDTIFQKKENYECDIVYATNHELGFDYLRDNLVHRKEEKVQNSLDFVIIDEVDSILIDEARTPLIISGETNSNKDVFILANETTKNLIQGKEIRNRFNKLEKLEGDFIIDEEKKEVFLTEEGITKVEKFLGLENLYEEKNATMAHYVENALKAHYIMKKDKEYVVKDGEIVIVDEFTGRLSEGRRFGEGLHQALEVKEGVKIQSDSQTLSSITYQNFFRLYKRMSGMTGTAQTEATEFAEIYKLNVISIPTNIKIKRIDRHDLIFMTEKDKFNAIFEKILEINSKGQPILIGTASIEKSELLHKFLEEKNIKHNVLNAKNHEYEARIIEKAGEKGAVTIATNMAGRGVDIKINDEVNSLGGLYIIGTERHDSRRIDNQLRGRAGRQGDNGYSIFYLSLEDHLIKTFGGEKLKTIVKTLGIDNSDSINSGMLTKSIEKAQKRIEDMNFESRKYVIEFDNIVNEQRKVIYKVRNDILDKKIDFKIKNQECLSMLVDELFYENDLNSIQNLIDIKEEHFRAIENIFIKKFNFRVVDFDKLPFKSVEDIKTKFMEIINIFHNQQISIVRNEEELKSIYSSLYLQVLDILWRSHLESLDNLKSGINLRSYNQKDPLTEFKKDSFVMFQKLITDIKIETRQSIFNIVLQRTENKPENNDTDFNNLIN